MFKSLFKWIRRPTVAYSSEEFTDEADDGIENLLDDWGQKLVSQAKANAPWQDRTGEARRLLNYDVELVKGGSASAASLSKDGREVTTTYNPGGDSTRAWSLVLYHGAAHGRWLEIAHQGVWGILLPTMEPAYGPIKKSLDDLTKGGGA